MMSFMEFIMGFLLFQRFILGILLIMILTALIWVGIPYLIYKFIKKRITLR